MDRAIVVLSGGLDSTTALTMTLNKGIKVVRAISFNYGQKHFRELLSAKKVTSHFKVPWDILSLKGLYDDMADIAGNSFKSALLQEDEHPVSRSVDKILASKEIPNTFVPGRNLFFLSAAAVLAQSLGANIIVMGVNVHDYSGYPDCREDILVPYLFHLSRGLGITGDLELNLPIVNMTKAQIIIAGQGSKSDKYHTPFHLTWSCYAAGTTPCGECDSCRLRAKGFKEAGLEDNYALATASREHLKRDLFFDPRSAL